MTTPPPPDQQSTSAIARIRALPLAEALRLARSPDIQERVALERTHGKLAWESLLRNPSLTIPEVIRIANMGTLSGPLIDIIVSNPAWLTNEQVRRALLANRALRGQNITTVLRSLPKAELELVLKQAAYSGTVREAARRLLGR
jgi:hypothetical protein